MNNNKKSLFKKISQTNNSIKKQNLKMSQNKQINYQPKNNLLNKLLKKSKQNPKQILIYKYKMNNHIKLMTLKTLIKMNSIFLRKSLTKKDKLVVKKRL